MSGTFDRLPWSSIFGFLEARLVKESGIEFAYLNRRFMVADNGGEFNIFEIVPAYQGSIAYSFEYAKRRVPNGPATIACRIHAALTGQTVDYTEDVDAGAPSQGEAAGEPADRREAEPITEAEIDRLAEMAVADGIAIDNATQAAPAALPMDLGDLDAARASIRHYGGLGVVPALRLLNEVARLRSEGREARPIKLEARLDGDVFCLRDEFDGFFRPLYRGLIPLDAAHEMVYRINAFEAGRDGKGEANAES